MIDTTIKITLTAKKRNEVLQTFRALLDLIRHEHGCISCNCYQDVESENVIFFQEEWESHEDLDNHLKSEHFSVLTGAMKLLENEPEIRFKAIAYTAGAEAIQAARAK